MQCSAVFFCIAAPLGIKDPKADPEQPAPGIQTHGQPGSVGLSWLWITLHSCGQRINRRQKSWCLSSIPFFSSFPNMGRDNRMNPHCTILSNKLLWLRSRIVLDSVQTDLGSDIFVFPSTGNRLAICLGLFFSYDIISFQIMLVIIFSDAVPTHAVHSSMFSTDILMLRKAKGREFITEAPFRLLARCSEKPVVPSHFLWTRIHWSIQPSRVYSPLFPFGTYTVFCKSLMKKFSWSSS